MKICEIEFYSQIKSNKMKKKALLGVLILILSGSAVRAQFSKGDVLFSAGASFGNYGYFGSSTWIIGDYNYMFIPPVVAKLEIGIHDYLGVGAFGGLQFRKYTSKLNSAYHQYYSYISGGAIGSFHFTELLAENLDIGNLEELDMYLTTTMRLEFSTYESSYYYDPATKTYISYSKTDVSPRWGGGLGFRYFFTKNMAVFGEIGSCNLGYLTLGGTIKF